MLARSSLNDVKYSEQQLSSPCFTIAVRYPKGGADSILAKCFYNWQAPQESNQLPLEIGSSALTTMPCTPYFKMTSNLLMIIVDISVLDELYVDQPDVQKLWTLQLKG